MSQQEPEFFRDTLETIKSFPRSVRRTVGHALAVAALGERPVMAKPLKGFRGASVMEICDRAEDGTYRVVYMTEIKNLIVVIHAFQKKSKTGIKTPRRELELIKSRLKEARNHYGKQ